MSDGPSLPDGIDPRTPNNARMYDYALGGKDNFAADRAVVEEVFAALSLKSLPTTENRRFMRRAVRFLLSQGVRQFLDIGCGLPGRGNVHDLAHKVDPTATVVYVDYDPVAVSHYNAILSGRATATAIHADARNAGDIMARPEVTRLIDFDRPVGLLMISVLELITDQDPAGIVAEFRDAMAPGGHLALSHTTHEGKSREELDAGATLLEPIRETWRLRRRDQITGFFDGFDILEPGIVQAPDWRPDRPYETPSGWLLAGVGRLGTG
jgi:SAM-dependent methyltransferase